jgi:hypothetical protein
MPDEALTGYEPPFQKGIFYASLFYLLVSLLFIKSWLHSYSIRPAAVFAVQMLMVLATNVTWYVGGDAAFSHVYSLAAISGFVFFGRQWFMNKKARDFIVACAFLGLVMILRQINVLVLLAIPVLAGSWAAMRSGIAEIFKSPFLLVFGGIAGGLVLTIQLVAWYLQTGHWVIYSYRGETFDFLNPEILNILFSFKKGLFVYTPVILLSFVGVFWMIFKRQRFISGAWLVFFFGLTYVLSSWWSWYYGASFGLRSYLEFYPILFLPLAMALNDGGHILRWSLLSLGLLCIPLNLIQTYQYRSFILHWDDMTRDKYFRVFLRTDDTFKGLIWKRYESLHQEEIIGSVSMVEFRAQAGLMEAYSFEMSHFIPVGSKLQLVSVTFVHDFPDIDKSTFTLSVRDSANIRHWTQKPLIHFLTSDFHQSQTGRFDYRFDGKIEIQEDTFIVIELMNHQTEVKLSNLRLDFYGTPS